MVDAAVNQGWALPGYTIREFGALAGVHHKDAYRLIRLGRVESYRDSEGQYRISPFEAYSFIKNREV